MTTYATEEDFTEETSEEAEAREAAAVEAEARAEMIANLRAFADALEKHPDLPRPRSLSIACYVDAEKARAGRRGIPHWTKLNSPESSYVTYEHVFGAGEAWSSSVLTYSLEVSKSGTCERVQVGTRHVEAQPAYEAPVFAWRCDKPDADETDDGQA